MMEQKGVRRIYDSLTIGESVSFSRTFTSEDIADFATLSGDFSPIHTDDDYAGASRFGGRIVHGIHLAAFVSQLLGMKLPGENALHVKETLEFKRPVMIGDTVKFTGTISQKSDATRLVIVDVVMTVRDVVVAKSEAVVQMMA